ncbi:hypothetical protein IVB40_07480 [Bradyrhizobium sp. 40]|uniref:hypothetical protein n=1 Tax=Bradyrhizobium sp. 40 TaxID=2782674 RepID=UPI001FFEBDDB|nr:hypothetical protein [Bradyrhizobium sp. 40]UPJ43901.1 hypothetical protein IVB40_07480 [Bradyrhizobium sp. 40]
MTSAARSDLPAPALRAAKVILMDEDGMLAVSAGIIVNGDDFPEVVMFNGDPFIADASRGAGCYRRVRPYRLDGGL